MPFTHIPSIPDSVVEDMADKMNSKAYQWLEKHRGISKEDAKRYEIGLREKGGQKRFSIPIRDNQGEVMNIRLWLPPVGDFVDVAKRKAAGKMKSWPDGIEGRGQARLYPLDQLQSDDLVLCEGELDALALISSGIPAITVTGGAGTWNDAGTNLLKDKTVTSIAYDNDEAGRKGAKKVAESLVKAGIEVKVLVWPKNREKGHDVSDELLSHGVESMRELIEAAPKWETPEQENGNAQTDREDPPEPKTQAEPLISEEAFHGLAGDIVRMIEPHTEADPVSMLVSVVAEFGCIVRRRPHLIIDDTYHPLLFWPVIVGASSKARKGSSGKRIKAVFKTADSSWTRGLNSGQLSSGEGMIWAVRDETYKKNKDDEEIVDDEGVQDKRLFLVQSEFGSMLKMMSREGNSLSGFIFRLHSVRVGWRRPYSYDEKFQDSSDKATYFNRGPCHKR